MAPNILVILTHPDLSRSRVNSTLKSAIIDLPNVTIRELYKQYPDGKIDVAAEQALLKKADLVVLQFPFYWYSSPSLLKEWEDRVLTYGFAFGEKGTELKNKALMVAISTAGPKDAYQATGYNRFTLRQLLMPFEQTAHLCQMLYQPPFAVQGVRVISDDDLTKKAHEYRQLLLGWTHESHNY